MPPRGTLTTRMTSVRETVGPRTDPQGSRDRPPGIPTGFLAKDAAVRGHLLGPGVTPNGDQS